MPPLQVEMVIEGKGTILMKWEPDKAPRTVGQIARLSADGFYDGQRIHRVEDWVVQWGDPQSRESNWQDLPVGTRGSGNQLPYEQTDIPMNRGAVAMASTGPKAGGDSQLFILTKESKFLEGNYSSFGVVISGMEVVDSLEVGDRVVSMRIVPAAEQPPPSEAN